MVFNPASNAGERGHAVKQRLVAIASGEEVVVESDEVMLNPIDRYFLPDVQHVECDGIAVQRAARRQPVEHEHRQAAKERKVRARRRQAQCVAIDEREREQHGVDRDTSFSGKASAGQRDV